MKEYKVTIVIPEDKRYVHLDIDANSREEAIEEAKEIFWELVLDIEEEI